MSKTLRWLLVVGIIFPGAFLLAQSGQNFVRVGIIGLDTSHSIAFTRILNNPDASELMSDYQVVAAYPHGSPDIESSVNRIPAYTEEIRQYGVKIVDSIQELLPMVDMVLLETNDGRPHLEQALPVLEAGKPLFVDKPVAASLEDAVAIYEAAEYYDVPVFSSSSLRYMPHAQAIRKGEIGPVQRAVTYSPAALEPSHPDLFWYGIHGVETLFTVMGTGCEQVTRIYTDSTDVTVGVWSDGRVGVFMGLRSGKTGYGGTAFGTQGISEVGPYQGYEALVVHIIEFFTTGVPPVEPEETLEIYAFMAAADESKNRNGAAVSLKQMLSSARASVDRNMWKSEPE